MDGQYDPFAATNAGMPQAPQQWPPQQPPMRPMGPGVPMPGPAAGGMQPQSQIDPAIAAQILALNRTSVDQAKVNRQMKMADALRGAAPGMMESRSPIQTPNWAGALAGLAGGLKARQLEGEAESGLKKIAGAREDAYSALIDQLRGSGMR